MEDKLGWAGWGAGRLRQAMMKAGWEGEDSRGIKAPRLFGVTDPLFTALPWHFNFSGSWAVGLGQ